MYTLLVIDMQPGFLKRFEDYNNENAREDCIENCRRAVVQAIADGAEIIDVNYDSKYGELGTTIPEIQSLWAGYRKLFKRRVKYIEKGTDGGGDTIMQNGGVAEQEIRVCGINAGACVRDTVIELVRNWGQDVSVIADAVANCWSGDISADLCHLENYAAVE